MIQLFNNLNLYYTRGFPCIFYLSQLLYRKILVFKFHFLLDSEDNYFDNATIRLSFIALM